MLRSHSEFVKLVSLNRVKASHSQYETVIMDQSHAFTLFWCPYYKQ